MIKTRIMNRGDKCGAKIMGYRERDERVLARINYKLTVDKNNVVPYG